MVVLAPSKLAFATQRIANTAPRFSTTIRRTNDVNVFHSLKEGPAAEFLSAYQTSTLIPQTLTGKMVRKYAVGVAKDKVHMIIHGQ